MPVTDHAVSFRSFVLAGSCGASLAGLIVAGLTLRLNPHLHESARESVVLCSLFFVVCGCLGGLLGAVAGTLSRLWRGLSPSWTGPIDGVALSLLALTPLLYVALLPDAGLSDTLLTELLFSHSLRLVVLCGLLALAFLGAVGVGLRALLRRAGRHLRWAGLHLGLAVWGLLATGVLLSLLVGRPQVPVPMGVAAAGGVEAPEQEPVPVLLLCVDGADPDDVLWPMIARGELPTFGRLQREGAWGTLETIYPTLSPAVWTTIVTGKPPQRHGIHQFVVFQLPGLKRPVLHFPLHVGLNFELFPRLARLPGVPDVRHPYTSNMRRAKALWNIVGTFYPVGVYRWRVTWPAEPVNGFNVGEGVALLDLEPTSAFQEDRRTFFPPELFAGSQRPLGPPLSVEEIGAYVGEAFVDDLVADPDVELIRVASERRTLNELVQLVQEYAPAFVAAQFYSVDAFSHRFAKLRGRGGPFSNAVDQRYRYTDARLGELMDALGDEVNLIVVSDHGYDFEGDQHTHAPPGIFFGWGPAFRRGVRVDDLSVYDVAPMVLRLLALPLPSDMSGTARGRYRHPLTASFLEAHPEVVVPTYEEGSGASYEPITSPLDEETRQRLKSLGYIE